MCCRVGIHGVALVCVCMLLGSCLLNETIPDDLVLVGPEVEILEPADGAVFALGSRIQVTVRCATGTFDSEATISAGACENKRTLYDLAQHVYWEFNSAACMDDSFGVLITALVRDTAGHSAADTVRCVVDEDYGPAPVPVFPLEGHVYVEAPSAAFRFEWQWPGGTTAQKFEIQAAQDTTFTDPVSAVASYTYCTLSTWLETGTWWWRVRALDAEGWPGRWCVPSRFVCQTEQNVSLDLMTFRRVVEVLPTPDGFRIFGVSGESAAVMACDEGFNRAWAFIESAYPASTVSGYLLGDGGVVLAVPVDYGRTVIDTLDVAGSLVGTMQTETSMSVVDIAQADSGFYCAVTSNSSYGVDKPIVLLDPSGTAAWSLLERGFGWNVASLDDGAACLAFGKLAAGGLFAGRYLADGSMVWSDHIHTGAGSYGPVHDLLVRDDGAAILAFEVRESSIDKVVLQWRDARGAIGRQREFVASSCGYAGTWNLGGLSWAPDGGILLAGKVTWSFQNYSTNADMVLLKLDVGGTIEWVRSYGDSVLSEAGVKAVVAGDDIILFGTRGGSGYESVVSLRLDEAGEPR